MASTQSQTQAARGADPDADPDSGAVGDIHARRVQGRAAVHG